MNNLHKDYEALRNKQEIRKSFDENLRILNKQKKGPVILKPIHNKKKEENQSARMRALNYAEGIKKPEHLI